MQSITGLYYLRILIHRHAEQKQERSPRPANKKSFKRSLSIDIENQSKETNTTAYKPALLTVDALSQRHVNVQHSYDANKMAKPDLLWIPSQQCSSVTEYEDMGFQIINHENPNPIEEERERLLGALALVELSHGKPSQSSTSSHVLLR